MSSSPCSSNYEGYAWRCGRWSFSSRQCSSRFGWASTASRSWRSDAPGRNGQCGPVPTYATAATFRIDLTHESDQRDALAMVVVPGVRTAPGVVSGTWTLDRDRSETLV